MTGITPFVHTNSGCDYHRVILPLKYLGVDVNDFANINDEQGVEKVFSETKVAFFNRQTTIPIEWFEAYRKKYGFKVVVDIDDYWRLYPKHNLYKIWRDTKTEEKIVSFLKSADIVFCTNELLQKKVKPINSNVIIVPNALPFDKEQFNTTRMKDSDYFRIIYAGGSSHFWDIRSIKSVFDKLKQMYIPNPTKFILAGHDGKENGEFSRMERLFPKKGISLTYDRRESLPLENYMDHYMVADLSIAPLETNYFNLFKSNLKILEAGCKNIPIICSNIDPYTQQVDANKVLIASNTSEWISSLMKLIKNPNLAIEKGLELGEYVRSKYDLLKINEIRRQVFEHLSK